MGPRHPTLADGLLAFGFSLLICVPGLWMLLGRSSADDVAVEFRTPAEAPELTRDPSSWAAFPKAAEAYFADRYGQRANLLRLRAWIYWELLQASPTEIVVRGQHEWVFYTAAHVLDTNRGVSPLSEQQVEEWLDTLAERSRRLSEQGIVHLIAFAPDKSAAYPEYLPWNHARRGQRRVDQLVAAARARGQLNLLDLTDSILAAKGQDQGADLTYYPLGSHWTPRGALAACEAIVARLRELGATPNGLELEALQFELDPVYQGDSLAQRLYLEGSLKQSHYAPVFAGPVSVHQREGGPGVRLSVWRREPPVGPNLLVMHDSFGPETMPFLSRAGSQSRWEWRPGRFPRGAITEVVPMYDLHSVLREKPDIVVELWVERMLATSLPPADEPLDQARLAERFLQASPALDLQGAALPKRLQNEPGVVLLPAPENNRLRILHENGEGCLRVDLTGLPFDREILLRLELEVRNPGYLSLRYAYRDGGPAYANVTQHRDLFALSTNTTELYLRVQRQRSSKQIKLYCDRAPWAWGLRSIEVRTLPDDAPTLFAR